MELRDLACALRSSKPQWEIWEGERDGEKERLLRTRGFQYMTLTGDFLTPSPSLSVKSILFVYSARAQDGPQEMEII